MKGGPGGEAVVRFKAGRSPQQMTNLTHTCAAEIMGDISPGGRGSVCDT